MFFPFSARRTSLIVAMRIGPTSLHPCRRQCAFAFVDSVKRLDRTGPPIFFSFSLFPFPSAASFPVFLSLAVEWPHMRSSSPGCRVFDCAELSSLFFSSPFFLSLFFPFNGQRLATLFFLSADEPGDASAVSSRNVGNGKKSRPFFFPPFLFPSPLLPSSGP